MDVVVTYPSDQTAVVTSALVAHGYMCEEPIRLSVAPEAGMVISAHSAHEGKALSTTLDEFHRLSEGLWFDPTTMYLRLNDDQGYIEHQPERSHHGCTLFSV